MVSIEDAVIASINKKGKDFEILVDPDKALELKRGKEVSVQNTLAVNQIFKDAKKGDKSPDSELKECFDTIDLLKIAAEIIKEGRLQLTTEQKRKLTEEKRTEIANLISREGVDPKTHIPHPTTRILNAMRESHLDIDPFKPAKMQMQAVIDKIQSIIPISFEKVTLAIKIPVEFAGKAGHTVREMAEVKKEDWTKDGWIVMITISAGLQTDIMDKLNKITAGRTEIKVVNRESI